MTIDEKMGLVVSLIFVSKKYNEAIDLLNKALPDASTDEDYQQIYQGLSMAYENTGNTSQAIAYAKLAADYGHIGMVNYLENVFNINYTPQKPSSSSAPNSGGSSAQSQQSNTKFKCPHCGFVNEKEPIVVMSEKNLFHGNLYCNNCHETFKC